MINVTHIMKNGEIRQSVKGLKITNKEFYIVFNEINSKKKKPALPVK